MTRYIGGFDCETTGLDPAEGHKIIELALSVWDLDTRKKVAEYVERFDPERSIDPGAAAVHGITYSMVQHEPKFRDRMTEWLSRFGSIQYGCAHNAPFDIAFLDAEFAHCGRHGVLSDLPVVDTAIARWATPLGKTPNLGELAFALRVPYDPSKAHGALYDIDVTMACFFKGLDRGFFKLPELLTM